jgi:hypothetical protein
VTAAAAPPLAAPLPREPDAERGRDQRALATSLELQVGGREGHARDDSVSHTDRVASPLGGNRRISMDLDLEVESRDDVVCKDLVSPWTSRWNHLEVAWYVRKDLSRRFTTRK